MSALRARTVGSRALLPGCASWTAGYRPECETCVSLDPVIIHGMQPRSGSNFLCDLLLLHPDCTRAVEPVHEDMFLNNSDALVTFAESVRTSWDPRWGECGSELGPRLYAALGEGLLSFLWPDRSRRLVTKSPSVRHLDRFFSFFPTARLLILIRDGRSVVQSCMDTFGWSFERATRAWAAAADEICRFRDAERHRVGRWRIVRYEALIDDLERELSSILQFAGLDPAHYDFDAARNLPVRGSSVFFGQGRTSVHWEPVRKDASFAPQYRWRHWSRFRIERFEWLAGSQLRALGYESAGMPRAPWAVAWHWLLDGRWSVHRAAHRVRTVLGGVSRPLRVRLGLAR